MNLVLCIIFLTAVFNIFRKKWDKVRLFGEGQKHVEMACMKKLIAADDLWEFPVGTRSKIFCISFWYAIT